MRKYFWCFVLVLAGMVRHADAKRDFYVESEVRCGAGEVCYFLDGQPFNGKLRLYYPSGVVSADIEYQNGVKNGVQQKFYTDGKQRAYAVFANGKVQGGASFYYPNGRMEFEEQFDNGVLNGIRRGFYEDGTLKLEETYVSGFKDGRERRYYPNGKLQAELFFDHGKVVSAACWHGNGARLDFTENAEEYIQKGIIPCRLFKIKLL